jgi:autotransporter-associated beta strand protein
MPLPRPPVARIVGIGSLLWLIGSPAFAQFIPTSGTAEYTNTASWTGGVINDQFTNALTGPLTATFAANRTTVATGMSFNEGGGGTLTLQSADATARLLTLAGDVTTGSSTTGNVVTIGNATNPLNMDLGGASRTITVGTGDTLTIAGAIGGGAFGITKAGAGTLTLSGTSTYTGPTAITGGILTAGADLNLGAPPTTQNTAPTTATPGTLVIAGTTFRPTASFTFDLNRGIVIGTATGGGGSGTIDVPSGVTLLTAGFIANNTGGSARLIKTGPGQLTLNTANNTFNGGVSILGGTLRITGDRRLGATLATATPGYIVIDGGILQFGGATSPLTLTANRGIALGPVSGSGTGTFDIVNTPVGTASVVYGGIIANNTNGATTGTGALAKTGGSILNLTGANTYTGGSTVSAGTLLVNNTTGSGTGTGLVTVNGGAFGGGGSISGGVTVNSGGSLAPGLSPTPGKLTVGGATTLTSGSTFAVDVNGTATAGTDFGQLAGGSVTLGNATLQVTSTASSLSGTVPIITYSTLSGIFNNLPDNSTVTFPTSGSPGAFTAKINYGTLVPGQVTLSNFAPVPEPLHVLLSCGVVGGVIAWRRRCQI